MRIAIIGAGALGTALVGLLRIAADAEDHAEPLDIWLIGSASVATHINAIRTQGLRLDLAEYLPPMLIPNVLSRFMQPIHGIHVTDQPREAFPCELAIVLVKSYRSDDAGKQAIQLLADDGLLIGLQNGIGNDAVLATYVPADRLVMGATLLGATSVEAGRIKVASLNPTTIAWLPQFTERQRGWLMRLQALLKRVHAPLSFAEDVQRILWSKLLVNCAMNPLTALLEVPNGVLVETPSAYGLMTEVVREVLLVAQTIGIDLPYSEAEAMAMVERAVSSNRANLSSMLQDRMHSKRTEIDALNGAVVRLAHEHGLRVPINETLVHMIHAMETRYGVRTLD
jgi:2-dehydropantoate 2-reductase